MLPIYWLVAMSFKTTNEILEGFSLFPQTFTLAAYHKIFTDPTWYWGYINALIYVSLNTIISLYACPASGLCLFALSVFGGQNLVLLVADQSHGPHIGLCLTLFSTLLGGGVI